MPAELLDLSSYDTSKKQHRIAESLKCQKSHLHMRINLLENDDSPGVGQSAETKTVHKLILLYRTDLLASAKVVWTTSSQ
jgi:hypothetical protein|tara:strand:+ start:820 stop:1059 length:240 start_codon:yes stop_codon:yes gene_type:complete